MTTTGTEPGPGRGWAVAALLFNAFVWGVSWAPFRWLESQGLHVLWATALIYLLAIGVITVTKPGAWSELLRTPTLWLLMAASGTTNAAFNWGVTAGDVLRVVLLFYLMPLWAVLLARLLLGEPISWGAMGRALLAVAGAVCVLWPAEGLKGGLPLPRTTAEWLGVLGGFTFALNNVLLRREAHRGEGARALAMFAGGALIAGGLAAVGGRALGIAPPPAPAALWLLGALVMGLAFLASNLALQHGASRLPAQLTSVVMITEVLFAGASAVAFGAAQVTAPLLWGALLIVGASLLAIRGASPERSATA